MTIKFMPQVAVIDFHHARGPEVEFWVQPIGTELNATNDWSLLPFLALADGAHAVEEEFSYFTLLAKSTSEQALPRSLFGIACTRQVKTSKLTVKSADVTRSTVQKAVVVVLEKPGKLGEVRERLGAVTAAWFGQLDFTSKEILQDFQDSLNRDATSRKDEPDHYIGLSLREIVYEFRHQTLVLFKALLLQKKMLFFGSRCERLCLLQFALISLIPNLPQNLQDCADPDLNTYASTITRAASLRSSDRSSLLAYMGLPLQIFGRTSFFSPYTPLQLLDVLMSTTTHSFVVGSTNNLLLSQKERYTDILINLDEEYLSTKVQILNPSLRNALSLSAADRRWIDNITQTVIDTWDPANPDRPTTHGYSGSEDAIRLHFEEYLLSLCSSAAYKSHVDSQPPSSLTLPQSSANDLSSTTNTAPPSSKSTGYADPIETSYDFNPEFLSIWRRTPNYALFSDLTQDASIFDIIPPKHPTAGGLGIEDVQRRLALGVAELHLDEKYRESRETVGRVLGEGRERVGAGVARFWKEVEGFRERREMDRQREEQQQRQHRGSSNIDPTQLKDNITGIDLSNPTPTSKVLSTSTTGPPSSSTGSSLSATAAAASVTASAWLSGVRDRASKVQIQRPDVNTAQIGSAAKENAAKAGAYLSSWGSWAKDRSKEWTSNKGQQGVEGLGGGGGGGGAAATTSTPASSHVPVATSEAATGGSGVKPVELSQLTNTQTQTASTTSKMTDSSNPT